MFIYKIGCYDLLAEIRKRENSVMELDDFQHLSNICVLDNKAWSYIHDYKISVTLAMDLVWLDLLASGFFNAIRNLVCTALTFLLYH